MLERESKRPSAADDAGVSVLAQPRCVLAPSELEGSFDKAGAPMREATGTGLTVSGIVRPAWDLRADHARASSGSKQGHRRCSRCRR